MEYQEVTVVKKLSLTEYEVKTTNCSDLKTASLNSKLVMIGVQLSVGDRVRIQKSKNLHTEWSVLTEIDFRNGNNWDTELSPKL